MKPFKNIPGYSTDYSVSKDGCVRGPRKILKPSHDSDGYRTVNVKDINGKFVTRKVSRLVALAFKKNPTNLPIADHENRVRHFDDESNIRWVDNVCNSLNNDSDGVTEVINRTKPFRARVGYDGKVFNLGYFKTRAEATKKSRELREILFNIRYRAITYNEDSRSPCLC